MSKSVEERVVQMGFENKQFESNAKETMSTLDKLKQSLNFNGASKSFNELNKASKGIDLSGLASGIDIVSKRFSTLGIVGVTALQNITNQVLNTAKNLVNELSLAPIMSGFREYETQIGAIQTILANTSAQGTTLEQVNAALDELNTYADKTIYNFTEMTRNIGTFTAAGVNLKTSTEAIKGIANLAAMSGSTSQQASTAMYQLSQALAAGRVSLQDWNSVVNAGMGGKVFQDALMQTAETMGIVVDRSKSFRESISTTGGQQTWLTSEVLLNTLRQFTGDMTDAELAAMGFNEEQVKAIQAQAKTANEAATQVKTLTQLMDTMKESVSSGWTETWEIIVGDFTEARSLFTNISNVFGDFISKTSDARNDLLRGGLMSGWKQFLNEGISNQDDFIESIRSVSSEYGVAEETIDSLIKKNGSFDASLREGWMTTDILKASVADYTKRLNEMSTEELEAAGYTDQHVQSLNELNENIQNGSVNLDDFVSKMSRASGRENIIEGLSQAFRVLLEVVRPVKEAFDSVFEALKPEELYQATVSFKEFFTNLSLGEENAKNLKSTFEGVFSVIDLFGKLVSSVWKGISSFGDDVADLASKLLSATGAIGEWVTSLNETVDTSNPFSIISDTIIYVLDGAFGAIRKVIGGFSTLGSAIKTFGSLVSDIFGGIFDVTKKVLGWLFNNLTLGDIASIFTASSLGSIATTFSEFTDKVKEALDFSDIFKGAQEGSTTFTQILSDVHGALVSFQEGIRVTSLAVIAGAVALLASSIKTISGIKPEAVVGSLVAIRILMSFLNSSFKSLTKILKDFKTKGAINAALTMIAMAKGVDILADAVTKIADLNFGQLLTGVAGVGALLAELALAMNLLSRKSQVNLRSSVAILVLSVACEKLSEAIIPLSKLSWSEIQRGLVAMGGALGEFSASMAILGKFGGMGSLLGATGILIASQSLYAIAENLEALGSMSWDTIQRGLTSMGVALGEFTVSLSVLSKVGGFGSILGSVGLLIGSQSLYAIAENLEKLGTMPWDTLQQGLEGMAAVLFEFTVSLSALSYFGGFGALLGGGAILIASQSLYAIAENLEKMGSMPWPDIQNGLIAMGGALAEIAVVTGALGSLAGLSGLVGAGTILLAVQGLDELASALEKFGSMSWDEIKRGLVGMGGALTELSVISGGLGNLSGLSGLVGAGTILLAVQGLDELASALEKFGSMSWPDIKNGLAAMGGALSATALGGLANTFSGLGALSIGAMVEPLSGLADSIKKWAGVKVPEGISLQLQSLASGVNAFMFSGWGADALSTIALPIGDLAESMKKWIGVSVPSDIGTSLSSLADGVNEFMFAGWGANSVATVAVPLGEMADSVKKWADVSVPEGIGAQMTSLASGVNAFLFAGWGADSLAKVAAPLGELSTSISKWSGITIPENLGEQLESLADGVKAFTFAFIGGFSIDAIRQPLINLADAVVKWKDVSVPATLKEDLTNLADGVKAFSFAFVGGWSVGQITGPLSNLADSVRKWSGIDVSNVGPQLETLADGVNAFANSGISDYIVNSFVILTNTLSAGSFASIVQNVDLFSQALSNLSSIDMSFMSGIEQAFSNFSTTAVTAISTSFTSGINSIIPNFQMTAMQLCTVLITTFTAQNPKFMQAGMQFGMQISLGLTSQAPSASNAARMIGTSAVSQLQGLSVSFKIAGQNAGAGFVAGLNEYAAKAAEAASQMAQQAVNAVNKALDAHSPSKKTEQSGIWGGQGFVNGFKSMFTTVKSTAYKLGDSAVESLNEAITRASNVLASTSEIEPSIRPVVDLSDVKKKAAMINSEFSAKRNFSISPAVQNASSAFYGFASRQNGDVRGADSQTNQSSVQSFNFTQNNYSPKALSRSEIYRDTKNQFSMIKGVVSSK